jgi:hypothetical protein
MFLSGVPSMGKFILTMDGTYRLLSNGMLVFILGSVDITHRWYPLLAVVMNTETDDDIAWVLQRCALLLSGGWDLLQYFSIPGFWRLSNSSPLATGTATFTM